VPENRPDAMVWIDQASHEDLAAMAGLLAELFAQEHDFHPDAGRQLAGLNLILDNPALGRLFVVRVDGEVVAMANVLITISTAEGGRVAILEDVIVRERQRGLGIGRRLVEHVLDWARQEGMTRITLLTDHDNVAGQAFYARQGFRPSSMRVMRMSLNPR